MAETAPAAAAAPVKATKKKAPRAKKTGPSVAELIVKAISASKEKKGVSLSALKKALAAGGYDVEKNNSRVKLAIKSLVTKETLVQIKGTGASGSFKLNKKQAEPKKPAAKAKKPTATKKPKKAAAKKPVAAKKSPKKVASKKVAPKKATKSPKKAKKAVTPKKAAKSPKKATKAVTPKKAVTLKKTAKSPKKVKAAKPKVAKPKTVKPKKAAPKKK